MQETATFAQSPVRSDFPDESRTDVNFRDFPPHCKTHAEGLPSLRGRATENTEAIPPPDEVL
jgi:hypothetical protein